MPNTISLIPKQKEVCEFHQLGLRTELTRAVVDAGFTTPTEIQRQAIPVILAGNDLIAQAQTGSGKTAAFALPALSMLKANKEVQILVLAPTRELAQQVEGEFNRLGRQVGVKTVCIVGGQAAAQQISAVRQGAQVVVATPGRLLDHLEAGRFKKFAPAFVVFDEADEMLDRGFIDDIHKILAFLPKERQTLMFSATLPPAIVRLAEEGMRDPVSLRLVTKQTMQVNIKQVLYVVKDGERSAALIRLLETEDPGKAIIFCRTRQDTEDLSQLLNKRGLRVRALHGDLSQHVRTQVLNEVKEGVTRVLIATDVASRGLDIADLTHVFNYHAPENTERYTHRIGRTGRAGKDGVAISLATPQELRGHTFYRFYSLSNFTIATVPGRREAEQRLNHKLVKEIAATEISTKAAAFAAALTELQGQDSEAFLARLYSYLLADQEINGPETIGFSQSEIAGLASSKNRSRGPSKFDPRERRRSSTPFMKGGFGGGSQGRRERPAAGGSGSKFRTDRPAAAAGSKFRPDKPAAGGSSKARQPRQKMR